MSERQTFYIIFGNNEHTQKLVDLLRDRDDGIINVVDEYQEHSMIVRDEVTYIQAHYLQTFEDLDVNIRFFHYIDPINRAKKWD